LIFPGPAFPVTRLRVSRAADFCLFLILFVTLFLHADRFPRPTPRFLMQHPLTWTTLPVLVLRVYPFLQILPGPQGRDLERDLRRDLRRDLERDLRRDLRLGDFLRDRFLGIFYLKEILIFFIFEKFFGELITI
jgi:hypothetical protein